MTFYLSGNVYGDGDPYSRVLRSATVYEAASASAPHSRLRRAVKHNLNLLTNSSSLMGTTVVNSVLGFFYWSVAARAFPPRVVGQASAAVSALTLVGTLSMFGMGTLLISELPRLKDRRWNLIATCLLVTGSIALVGGLVYVLLAQFVLTGLRATLESPLTSLLLVFGIVVTAMTLVLDDGLVGLLAGPLQLARNTYFAVIKLVALGVLAVLPIAANSSALLAIWVLSSIVSVALLGLRLRSKRLYGRVGPISLRPRLSILRGLVRQAFDHNVLNLALFLPRTMLPILVAAVLSPLAAGAFYTAYMMLSFLTMIPNNLATTLFAVAQGDETGLRSKIRMALLISAGVGIPGALLLAALSRLVMEIFGHAYALAAGDALAMMSLIYPAMLFRPLYVAISRVLKRVRRASVFAIVAGALEVAAAVYGGSRGSLTSLALWLSGVFLLEGLITAPVVLRVALSRPRPARHVRRRNAPADRNVPAQRRPVAAAPSYRLTQYR